jgi:hypothetical protein
MSAGTFLAAKTPTTSTPIGSIRWDLGMIAPCNRSSGRKKPGPKSSTNVQLMFRLTVEPARWDSVQYAPHVIDKHIKLALSLNGQPVNDGRPLY